MAINWELLSGASENIFRSQAQSAQNMIERNPMDSFLKNFTEAQQMRKSKEGAEIELALKQAELAHKLKQDSLPLSPEGKLAYDINKQNGLNPDQASAPVSMYGADGSRVGATNAIEGGEGNAPSTGYTTIADVQGMKKKADITPQSAALIANLESSKKGWEEAKTVIMPNGKLDRTAVLTGGFTLNPWSKEPAGLPFSQGREAYQKMNRVLFAKLRLESGAAVPDTELYRYAQAYLPKIGDSETAIKSKLESIDKFINGMSGAGIKGVSNSEFVSSQANKKDTFTEVMKSDPIKLLSAKYGEVAVKKMLSKQKNEQKNQEVELPNMKRADGSAIKVKADVVHISQAIAKQESGGNYKAIGPMTKYGRALGKYQILPVNVTAWSREILGKEITPQQFMENTKFQDAIAIGKMSSLYAKYGNAADVASIWHSGRPAKGNKAYDKAAGISTMNYVASVLKHAKNPPIVGNALRPPEGQ